MSLFPVPHSRLKHTGCAAVACAVLFTSACSSGVAPSKTASNAGTGAVIGGLGGAVVGSNSSMGTGTGAAVGAGAGALIGGIVGLVQEAKDRKEQDRLAQERAYQQDLAKKRSEEARRKAEMEEELAIAQGFRISDIELNDAQKKLESVKDRLKRLEDERAAAKAKKLALDDAKEKTLQTEAKIAQLEEELARLKGEDPTAKASAVPTTAEKKLEASPPAPSAAVKPGN
ncbi:MAG: hypothetical protein HZA93_14705 [Verrucomicrobia bacterium]|nr:hypothetical protein [Verrucomicrobiota bacterium]